MTQENHNFKLSREELEYLEEFISRKKLASSLIEAKEVLPGCKATIRLNRAEAERLRDCLTTELAAVGFDENYSLNKEGRMIEQLVDKFFIP